jgi:hypothetical protein
MASATPTRLLADKLIPDGVDQFIAQRRDQRKSWRRIALDLRDQTSGVIDVTPETVRKWATSLSVAA